MAVFISRGLILVVCIGYFALQAHNVSCIRNTDLALRYHSLRSSKETVVVDSLLKTSNLVPAPAPAPSLLLDSNPNQSDQKRSVGKGSDPIHNKMLTFSKAN
ncbi:hypothetical protein ACFE04_024978 [Oxalis oulophora]